MRTPKKGGDGKFVSGTPKICIVGAGFGGQLAAIQLKRRVGLTTFTVLDKNHDFGGVWLTTKYPGISTDLPGYMYCYSFDINFDITQAYPDGPEQWQYFRRMGLKYKLYEHTRFNTTVSAMTWTGRKWIVTSSTGGSEKPQVLEEEYDMVIMATGPFHGINFPDQFKSFKGPLIHSAYWDANMPLENKVVGVVGSSASAIQLISNIEPLVKELVCYQRSAPYSAPKFQMRMPGWVNFLLRWVPGLIWIVMAIGWVFIELFAICISSSRNSFSSLAGWVCLLWMKWNVKDPTLRKGLTPDYKFGVRIPTISDTFYKAMIKKHVRLVKETIRTVEGNAIITEDGKRQELDVLILCTGYKLQDYFAPMKVTGTGGQDLLKLWKVGRPRTYYGTTCSAAPNLFILLGPNTVQCSGFVFPMECQMNIVINLIKHMRKIDATVFNVKEEAEEDCVRELERRIKKSLWEGASHQATWAVNEHGDHTVMWPGTSTSFWWKTRKFDANKFEFQKDSQLMDV